MAFMAFMAFMALMAFMAFMAFRVTGVGTRAPAGAGVEVVVDDPVLAHHGVHGSARLGVAHAVQHAPRGGVQQVHAHRRLRVARTFGSRGVGGMEGTGRMDAGCWVQAVGWRVWGAWMEGVGCMDGGCWVWGAWMEGVGYRPLDGGCGAHVWRVWGAWMEGVGYRVVL